ncbi:MAG TPA: 1-(5-phosphoribosyl)-5-[(5-phosphoribosylamino)methylideneamino] imidazole-4-carboxamide isomerase [Candidatus Saccharimonadales bacterium]|nr:1-(5-phosphoribosyl)-5-[(5-phosphoribosylamino)methylideneamino] imidazole-4-carboxamide isomerase [Candidatus Saccharimonadales bacterium]
MDVIPAVDVQGGRCVRLRQGEHAQETVYADDPVLAAQRFIEAGATRLHVVDLDAARGVPAQDSVDAVARLVGACVVAGCAAQVGGGIRDMDAASRWLDSGASLVILGSVAARDLELALSICVAARGRALLGLDVRAGVARVQGWTEDGLTAAELLRAWRSWPAAGVVYTDTTRDGVLTGPDLDGLRSCRELYGGPVIASGGIGTVDDITACAEAGAAAVVVGKALYEGRVDLAEALRAVEGIA